MKRMICEVCGGSDILKDKGAFVCQSCGCKHSLEEARKLLEGGNSIQQTLDTLFPARQTGGIYEYSVADDKRLHMLSFSDSQKKAV